MKSLIRFKNLVKLNQRVIEYAPAFFEVGISESELLKKIKTHFKNEGMELEFSFRPIIAFGKNSAEPHHRTGKTPLKRNQVVLIDLGLKNGRLISDLTRTFFFSGQGRNFFNRQIKNFRKVAKLVNRAQKLAIASMRAGVKCLVPDKMARGYLECQNLDKYFLHGTGHGLAGKIHTKPYLTQKRKRLSQETLKIGQKVTVEPGVYFKDKWGYRVEDVVIIKKLGAEVVSELI